MGTRSGNEWQFDHGTQYFTGRHPDFRAGVNYWVRARVAAPWTPRITVLGGGAGHRADPTVERFVGLPQMTAPARLMAEALDLATHTTIVQVQRRVDASQLQSAERGWLDQRFDAVLFSVPAPQVVPLLLQPFPQLAALAASAIMRSCWALMLRFEAPVGLPLDAAFVDGNALSCRVRQQQAGA